MPMKTVGLIVNPVAGMGGAVGLKGTDGDMYRQAQRLGAVPVSPSRTREFLSALSHAGDFRLLAAPGSMGAEHAEACGLSCEVIGRVSDPPTPQDTRATAKAMLEAGVDIIAFAGGDGTARDMVDAVGVRVPVVAIPSGVKIYSAAFAFSPRDAARLLDAWLDGAPVSEHEVLDIDEDAFRDGRVDARHYGFLLVPEIAALLQPGKESSAGSSAESRRQLAEAVAETMQPGTLYLLGSGTTVRSIADVLGIDKTLLGVDAVVDGRLVAADVNEQGILRLLDVYTQAVIIVTPLGGNGFVFGRGNKQFSPAVLRRVGRDNIVLVGDRDKLLQLRELHVDTGDAALDDELSGYVDVIVAPGHTKLMKLR